MHEPHTHTGDFVSWHDLSDQERVIARMVGQVLTNRQIATRLFLSHHTVNYHLRRIFRKLGINSRIQLAQLARDRPNLGPPR